MEKNIRFAFVSRHTPTADQIQLAESRGINLIAFGDMDAFASGNAEIFREMVKEGFSGVIVVHPLLALDAHFAGLSVGVFKNENRAPEGEKPTFKASELYIVYPNERH